MWDAIGTRHRFSTCCYLCHVTPSHGSRNPKESHMSRRHKMSKKHSRRSFSKGASHTHKKNLAGPMRGGIRL